MPNIAAAIVLAASLMGVPVPQGAYPSVVEVRQSTVDAFCYLKSYKCAAVFLPISNGKIYTAYPHNAELLAHEACHWIQWRRGERYSEKYSEPRCKDVQRRAR